MTSPLLLLAALALDPDSSTGEDTLAPTTEQTEAPALDPEASDEDLVEDAADSVDEPVLVEQVQAPKRLLPSELGSITPTLGSLVKVVLHLENAGSQITAMQLATVRMDTPAVEQHLLAAGEPVYFTVLGDPERVTDFRVSVLDPAGKEIAVGEDFSGVDFGSTEEGEPLPVPVMRRVKVTPEVSGYHSLQVDLEDGADDWGVGFYSSVLSYGSSKPVSIVNTVLTVMLSAVMIEVEGIQIQAAGWTTVSESDRVEIAIPVDTTFSECVAIGTADTERTKKMDVDVLEPGGGIVGRGSMGKRDAMTDFVVFSPKLAGSWRFGLTATKMQRGAMDSHAAMLVGCIQ